MDRELYELATKVAAELLDKSLSMVAAESCTGGWLSKTLTDVPGSSQWFEQGFITYSNLAKQAQLAVGDTLLEQHGAVSQAVVEAMVEGGLNRSHAQLAVAISGIAGPGGGTEAKPVGTVWFAWRLHVPNKAPVVNSQCKLFHGDREMIRRAAVHLALTGILQMVETYA